MNKAERIQKTKIHKLFRPFYGGIGHAIMFHRIQNEEGHLITKGLQITQSFLEEIIQYFISQNIDMVSLDEFYERLTSRKKTKRFVTFTFDDGYVDNLTHALPVFEKYNAPFSVFVTTGYSDKKVTLWWYLVEQYILKNDTIEFDYDDKKYLFHTSSEEEKRIAFSKIKVLLLESKSENEYRNRVNAIFENTDIDLYGLNDELIMSWDQVKELSEHPLATIGAHTVNHLALRQLDEKEVVEEIKGSIKRLEEVIGDSVSYFAYPYGTKNEAGEKDFVIAEQCGLKMAFTTEKDNIFKKQVNELHSIPRLGINSTMTTAHIDMFVNGMTPFISKFVEV
ncbi:polysaccharide deacetylase family protein [Carboxylicivirga sp. N1Y90]|uniref:polysaccharide deacetylase family protein n=1 Tax=Carboxylicivirga fragile TaxID=3417571 RepID=UPI003D33D60F|nr:polysaccharide deacetylase family protein [Marinilabiliaceae bacterium N1Y90]